MQNQAAKVVRQRRAVSAVCSNILQQSAQLGILPTVRALILGNRQLPNNGRAITAENASITRNLISQQVTGKQLGSTACCNLNRHLWSVLQHLVGDLIFPVTTLWVRVGLILFSNNGHLTVSS